MASGPQVSVHDHHAGDSATQGRRRWWRWLAALCLIALISALGYVLVLRPPSLPAPYQGADTANDELAQVATDPTGGVWAIGYHFDRPLEVGVPGVTQLSTFVLHLEGGTRVKRYILPSDAEGVQALAMTSASEGWLVGGSERAGLVVHYVNGGVTSTNAPYFLSAISMLSASEGWAVGNQGTILHYTVGTWTVVTSPTTAQLRRVAMVSPSEGWAVGQGGTILHYTDGNWSQVASPTSSILDSVAVSATGEGRAVGEDTTMLHLMQGKWVQVDNPAGTLDTVTMVSPDEGWAVGAVYSHSSNHIPHLFAGTWHQEEVSATQQLESVAAVSPSDVWAVGGHGTILHYTASGWSVVNGPQ